ncbi:MAG: hypothetical protein A2020_11550 [Lentisphaerae bacterium GWF2_45_14]|nr:MAG: hypothetical protein A2020_11550 [Lentisphaerae bacterium GWF2_45_14]
MLFRLAAFLILCFIFVTRTEARVYDGLEMFLYKHTNLVKGKRVGLVTNATGVDARLLATVDLFRADGRINLVALFAPEHGIRGDILAGENFKGGIDPITRLPIYTLYGGVDHKPPKEGLAKIDVLIFDIQDVGSRAYTYIWHMAECMSGAAQAGKTFIVLDNPNPLGAEVVDGPVTERKFLSFIGLYPVPRVYGMTMGELAKYLNVEEKINCNLIVIPMLNYKRGMSWTQTGLPWVPTSPHVPTPESACCFAATGTIGEIGVFNIGIGYTLPFQTVAAPWMNAALSTRYLNSLKLPGVIFRPIYYTPFYAAYKGQNVSGVQLHITDPAKFRPATTEVAILCHIKKYYPKNLVWNPEKINTFDKAMGTESVRKMILAGNSYEKITASWEAGIRNFDAKRKKYLIYK